MKVDKATSVLCLLVRWRWKLMICGCKFIIIQPSIYTSMNASPMLPATSRSVWVSTQKVYKSSQIRFPLPMQMQFTVFLQSPYLLLLTPLWPPPTPMSILLISSLKALMPQSSCGAPIGPLLGIGGGTFPGDPLAYVGLLL